jgi:hypothetical protein
MSEGPLTAKVLYKCLCGARVAALPGMGQAECSCCEAAYDVTGMTPLLVKQPRYLPASCDLTEFVLGTMIGSVLYIEVVYPHSTSSGG